MLITAQVVQDRPGMTALYYGDVHLGTWKNKWAKYIQTHISDTEELTEIEETLGWKEALSLLARRACFSSEIKQRLEDAGCSSPVIISVLEKCRKGGYINDDERSRRTVEILAKKGYGPLRIRQELKKRGIDLSECSHELHSTYISQYIEKHLPRPLTQQKKAKVIRALLRRGFSLDTIFQVLLSKKIPSDL